MRRLGCLEVGSGWCFNALHVAGVDNTIAHGISRWEPEDIDGNHAFRPDVAWRRQVLGPTGVALCLGVLAASSSASVTVVSPNLYVRFPVLGRWSGVDRGG